jgi:hypothetical protein
VPSECSKEWARCWYSVRGAAPCTPAATPPAGSPQRPL